MHLPLLLRLLHLLLRLLRRLPVACSGWVGSNSAYSNNLQQLQCKWLQG